MPRKSPLMPAKTDTPRAALLQLAKVVAGDLDRGGVGPGLQTVDLALSETPDAARILLDLFLAEARKKRPSGSLVEALLFLIGETLSNARMAL